jgi:peptidoglycan/LPS O-acetylase OafA/YrhL
MVRAMWRVFGGAAVVIAGIAAFIEAHTHRPVTTPLADRVVARRAAELGLGLHTGLSRTAYDLLRIGAWALVIVGGLTVMVGLIGYWGVQRRTPGESTP